MLLEPGAIVQLAFFERDADAFLTALVRAQYLERSGRRPALPVSSIYERFAEVYSLDAYEQLLDAEVDERVGMSLQRFVLEQHVRAAVALYDQQRAIDERLTVVEWEADAIPLRMARQLLATESISIGSSEARSTRGSIHANG